MMAADLVSSATSDKLPEVDWAKNIEICELAARDQGQANSVIKAIKKRLSKSSNAQLYAVMLLEMLLNNIGEAVHKQVIETALLPVLVKIVKKKFSQPSRTVASDHSSPGSIQTTLTVAQIASANGERATRQEEPQPTPGSSIIEKTSSALEVLREVLDAIDTQNPEAAKDEFTLDLVEQCSFQKDKVMHLVMSSRNEQLVLRAIELNEHLGKVLARYEALISRRPASTVIHVERRKGLPPTSNHVNHVARGTRASDHTNSNNHIGQPQRTSRSNGINIIAHETEEEEEAEQLSHRYEREKPSWEDEESEEERPPYVPSEIESTSYTTTNSRHKGKADAPPLAVSIPPPPAKHVERERCWSKCPP